ncbi:MAG: PspC domain-containing protein [Parabacteroides sp.]
MKKTLTVNLGGRVFHIDEDAYQLLDKYLSNLRIHFRQEESSDEIMNDFEMRISELLGERIRLGYEVITIEHVEEVIKRMGKPEEIFDEEGQQEHSGEQKAEQPHTAPHEKRMKKRLMRDPDNRILGGVAGGFAAYMDWDPTAVRIALFILMFFYGVTIPIYLLFWLIVPQARTATEKLQMRGESVTIENIGKTVTDGFERVSNQVNDYISSDKPRSLLQKMADAFVAVIGFLLKFLMVLISIITFPVLLLVVFILFMIFFGLVSGSTSILYHLSPFGGELLAGMPLGWAILGCVSLILLIGIPICALVYLICNQWLHVTMPNTAKWVLTLLWFFALIACGIYVSQVVLNGWSTLPWVDELHREFMHLHMYMLQQVR